MDWSFASLRLNGGFREIGCPVWKTSRRTSAFGRRESGLVQRFAHRLRLQVYIQNNRLVSLAGLKTFKFLRVSW